MQDAYHLSPWAPSVSNFLATFLTELHFELVLHCFLQFADLWCLQTMTSQKRGPFQLLSFGFPLLNSRSPGKANANLLCFQWEQERIDKKTTFFYYN